MAISINMQVSSTGGGSSTSSQGNSNTIAGLKQKLAALNKDLQIALGDQSETGVQKAKNIQLQIQMAQIKLNQLIQQEAEKSKQALEKTDTKAKAGAGTQSLPGQIRQTGYQNQIDVYV